MKTADPSYPAILFFYQGTVKEGEDFFGRFWPEARAVSDPSQTFYHAFGLGRGGVSELLGPRVWISGLRAALKGNSVGKPVGDPRIMPGLFLVKNRTIVWQHHFRHAGDHPDLAQIAKKETV